MRMSYFLLISLLKETPMNISKSTMSCTCFRLFRIAFLISLCLSLTSGCLQDKPPSNKEKSGEQQRGSVEKVLYSKNGVVYETDLSGINHRKIFSSHFNLWWDLFKYHPKERLFIYLTLSDKQQSQEYVLREYSQKTGEDKKIDSVQFLVDSSDENHILYTKTEKRTETLSPFMPPNKLFLYMPGKGMKPLGIQNIRQAVINAEADEFCYTSFIPVEQMTEPPSKIYISKLDPVKPQLIASFPTGTWTALVGFSSEHIIYYQGNLDSDAADASLYLFDRKTKQTRLVKERVMFMAINETKGVLLVAEKNTNSLKDFSVWEIQYDSNIKSKLFDLPHGTIKASPIITKYSPDGKYIVILNGWGANLGLYDFASKKYKSLFNPKDEVVRDLIFTSDSKNVLCTAGKPPTDSSIHKDTIYLIKLKSGKHMPITRPSKPDGNEIIKIIGVH